VEPSSHLRTRWGRENALTVEIDRQSDAGAINLDELMRLYRQQHD
jgi:hypothetical protein